VNDNSSDRLISLDAYRGFMMLAMVSGGLGLSKVAQQFSGSSAWDFLGYQFSHVAWGGCSFWDLIQPSFMFIVGVAMPYSYAKRRERGDAPLRVAGHVFYRALFLVLLGIFLRSNGRAMTNFTFEDVLTQIGLGYAIIYLVLGRSLRAQAAAATAILLGYWLLFALWPVPGPDFDAAAHHIPDDWKQFTGFAAHWNKHVNPAGAFDRWFLNLFPRAEPFYHNGGGYQTLSFIPSMGTMIFGIMTGELLRSGQSRRKQFRQLVIAGAAALALGMLIDGYIWPIDVWHGSLCPVVKRIWTPSWAVFSTGWALWILAGFFWLMETHGARRWAFPLVVVGMNSIAMYVMNQLGHAWVATTLKTHLGQDLFSGTYGPIVESLAVLVVLWLACYWLYRRQIFLRV
jgi:predicted acyltransferase